MRKTKTYLSTAAPLFSIGLSLAIVMGPGQVQSEAADSPSFRGPKGDGHSEEQVPTEWSAQKNVKWRISLPFPGHSTPVIARGRVYLTTANLDGTQRGLYCYDRNTGKELWKRVVPFDRVEPTHKTNPYGASSPVTDGKRVVVWHGSAGLFCYDVTGKLLWKLDAGDATHIWGYASSPVIYNDRVFLHHGPGVDTFMLAVRLSDGGVIWKTKEPGGRNDRDPRMVASFSTPVIAQVGGVDQLICSMPTRVVAYDPANGSIVWSIAGLPSPRGDLVYTSPLIAGNIGIAMGGYKGPRMAFRLGGSGDVTKTHRLWRVEDAQPQRIGSGVVVGDHVYIANAGPGTVECIAVKTGAVNWKARLPSGNAWSSTVRAGDYLFVTDQGATTHVFRPSPKEFQLVASNRLGPGEKSNATPAFSDGEIFLRTNQSLYCIGASR